MVIPDVTSRAICMLLKYFTLRAPVHYPVRVHVYVFEWLFEVLPLENISLVQSTARLLSLTAKKELTTPCDSLRERNSEAFYYRDRKGSPENCVLQ